MDEILGIVGERGRSRRAELDLQLVEIAPVGGEKSKTCIKKARIGAPVVGGFAACVSVGVKMSCPSS